MQTKRLTDPNYYQDFIFQGEYQKFSVVLTIFKKLKMYHYTQAFQNELAVHIEIVRDDLKVFLSRTDLDAFGFLEI